MEGAGRPPLPASCTSPWLPDFSVLTLAYMQLEITPAVQGKQKEQRSFTPNRCKTVIGASKKEGNSRSNSPLWLEWLQWPSKSRAADCTERTEGGGAGEVTARWKRMNQPWNRRRNRRGGAGKERTESNRGEKNPRHIRQSIGLPRTNPLPELGM